MSKISSSPVAKWSGRLRNRVNERVRGSVTVRSEVVASAILAWYDEATSRGGQALTNLKARRVNEYAASVAFSGHPPECGCERCLRGMKDGCECDRIVGLRRCSCLFEPVPMQLVSGERPAFRTVANGSATGRRRSEAASETSACCTMQGRLRLMRLRRQLTHERLKHCWRAWHASVRRSQNRRVAPEQGIQTSPQSD